LSLRYVRSSGFHSPVGFIQVVYVQNPLQKTVRLKVCDDVVVSATLWWAGVSACSFCYAYTLCR